MNMLTFLICSSNFPLFTLLCIIIFCRYEVMHRSIFSKFRRVEQVNMYLLLGQREKLLTHTLKKLPKTVSVLDHIWLPVAFVYCMNYGITLVFIFALSAPTASPQVMGTLQPSSAFVDPTYIYSTDSSSVLGTPVTNLPLSSLNFNAPPPASLPQVTTGLFVLNAIMLFSLHLSLKIGLFHFVCSSNDESYANLESFLIVRWHGMDWIWTSRSC